MTTIPMWGDVFVEQYLRKYARRHGRARSQAEVADIMALAGLRPGADVLDSACGFGRHAIPLAEAGCRVVGLDRSPSMLQEARRRSGGAEWPRWVLADYRSIPLPECGFDAVVNLFTSIGFLGDEGDQQMLGELHRLLRPGGTLVIDTTHRDRAVRRRLCGQEWERLDDGGILLERSEFDAVTGWLSIRHTYLDDTGDRTTQESRIRVYAVTELLRMLTAAGFADVRFYGDFDRRPLEGDTRLVAVARRAGNGQAGTART